MWCFSVLGFWWVKCFAEAVADAGPAQRAGRLRVLFPLRNVTDLVPISLPASQGYILNELLLNISLSHGSGVPFALEAVMLSVSWRMLCS